MKIGPNSGTVRDTAATPTTTPLDSIRAGDGQVRKADPVATVSLSPAAQAGKSAEVPFDDKKVAEIRQAIAEGRFPVDAERVAEKVIEHARQMLGIKIP